MAIKSFISALLNKGSGSSAVDAKRIRDAKEFTFHFATDTANAINSLQRQLDFVVTALKQNPELTEFEVTGPDGSLIAWIGSKVVNGLTYMGAWFREVYIGGTSAEDAVIVANSSGVVINGASIILNSNGVTTVINNVNTPPFGVLSLKSTDNTTGFWTGVHPEGVDLVDNLGNNLGYIRSGGGSGHIFLGNVGATKYVILNTGGAASPKLEIGSSGSIVVVSPSVPLSVNGTTAVDSARGGDFSSLAINGVPGINASDPAPVTSVNSTSTSVVTSVSAPGTTFVTGISLSTNTISYTPGASSATFVDNVSASTLGAITSVSAGTGSAVSTVTPVVGSSAGYTKGLRTS